MSTDTIYISKKQLSILSVGLMSLTRDDSAYQLGMDVGIFNDDDIYDYINTLKDLIQTIPSESGVLLVSELGKEITTDCIDLWGNPIGSDSN